MNANSERRTEKRLHYYWPIWFAEDFNDELIQGQMLDVSSKGAAFTCYNDGNSIYSGQEITTRFSIPHFGPNNCFDMENFTRSAQICRVDEVNNFVRKVAMQFAEPLPFKPGEQPTINVL